MPKLLEVARGFLTVCEDPRGSNRSPEIDEWVTALNAPLGSAWCSCYVHACLRASADPRPFVRSARVQTMVDGGTLVDASQAVPGDLVVFWFASLKRYAHIGLVERRTKTALWTYEGNTVNPDDTTGDQREGYGVFRRQRPITPSLKILRPHTP